MKIYPLITVLITLLFNACDEKNIPFDDHRSDSTIDFDSIEWIIRSKTDSFTEAHITRDTAYLNNSFCRDARVFPPNSNIVKGIKDISALNAQWVSYDIHEFIETSSRFYGNSELIIDEGSYWMKFGEDSLIDKGNYINVWKLEKGKWRISSNIWNSNADN